MGVLTYDYNDHMRDLALVEAQNSARSNENVTTACEISAAGRQHRPGAEGVQYFVLFFRVQPLMAAVSLASNAPSCEETTRRGIQVWLVSILGHSPVCVSPRFGSFEHRYFIHFKAVNAAPSAVR